MAFQTVKPNKANQRGRNTRWRSHSAGYLRRYAIPLDCILTFRFIAIIIFFTPQITIGGEVSSKNNELRSDFIQLALFAAVGVCEDPSREYYKKSLKELLDTGKKYDELTDADKSDLRKGRNKYMLGCQIDVLSSKEYKKQNLVKIYCYEFYLNRFESRKDYSAKVKFWDENGNVSRYVKDILKKIELDSDYDLNTVECFREIKKLHEKLINK